MKVAHHELQGLLFLATHPVGSEISQSVETPVDDILATRLQQFEAVSTVTAEITRELDLTTLLGLITRRAVELIDAAVSGAILLWDETEQLLIRKPGTAMGNGCAGYVSNPVKRLPGRWPRAGKVAYQQLPGFALRTSHICAAHRRDRHPRGAAAISRSPGWGDCPQQWHNWGRLSRYRIRPSCAFLGAQAAIAIEHARSMRHSRHD